MSSRPRRRELSPTARRQPSCCSRRSSPTLLQPRSTECPLNSCDRHRQPKVVVFESCFRFFGDTIIASHQAVRAKSHEATNKSTTPACLLSRPHRRELSPTARRRPFCCSRRSCPTSFQPSHRQHPGYSTAKSHEATSKSTTPACLSSTQPKLLAFEILLQVLKGPSLPTRAVPNSSSSHVLMSSRQPRPPTASPACLSSRPSTKAVPHSSSSPVLLFSKKLSDTVSTQCAPAAWAECLLSSCDRHHQPKLVVFEICFRFLKVQSSPATRLFERRAMKQRARARHQRVCRAVPVDKSCPPQLVVARSAVLEEAVQHRFHPVIASIQATQQRRAMKQRASKKLPDTASAQRVPASSTEFFGEHLQPTPST